MTSESLPFFFTEVFSVLICAHHRDGYTQHGDYVFGWKDDSLQRALDHRCDNNICDQLTVQTTEEADSCTIPPVVDELVDGWLDYIPGMPHTAAKKTD